MPTIIEGRHVADDARFAVVVSRFNEFITEALLDGALGALRRHGADVDEDVTVAWCPGAYEAPLVAQRFAKTGQYDAVICLGAVIRGATSHYDLVTGGAASGITHTMLETGVPVIFGMVTTDTIEQAIERGGTKAGNKGADAAVAALEMVSVLRQIDEAS